MRDSLLTAFRAARYRFEHSGRELVLWVDASSEALADVLHKRSAPCMAVLTAFNPQGHLRNDAENQRAQLLMQHDIQSAGYAFLTGRNEDPAGAWPAEPSFMVLGMDIATARALAARYRQLAFLWTDAATATPRLIETAATG